MKRIILVALFFLIFTPFMYLNAQWARTYGGSDDEWAYAIRQTSDGGYIVAGHTKSFGAGSADFWMLKLSSTGEIEEQGTLGGSEYDGAYCGQETSDYGALVIGDTYSYGAGGSDIWIIKLSSDGEIEAQGTVGGSEDDWSWYIQETSDGGALLAGSTYSFGAGLEDIWIIKFSSTGVIEAQATLGGTNYDWPSCIQETSDGGAIVAGTTYSFGNGGSDIWIIKFSSDGEIEAQATLGGSGYETSSYIQETSDGGALLVGTTDSFGAGSADFWIIKFSSDGDIEAQATLGGSEDDVAYSIQETSDGGCIVAGETYSFGAGDSDFWVVKLSSAGVIEWQKTYGGSSYDSARSVQETSDGGYIVAGNTESFGTGESDILILKLDSNGDIDSSCAFIGDSDATIEDTGIYAEDTHEDPVDTYVDPEDTYVDFGGTDVASDLLCTREYTLTISATTGGTTDPTEGSHTYIGGTEAEIEAIQETNYSFSGWTEDVPSGHENDNPITITMDADKSITANFTPTSDNGDGDGGGCFIATAAYGSPLHPNLDILRDFREKYLMPSQFGRKLVELYYRYSPIIANFIAKHKVLKVAVRVNLLPVIAFSYSMVHSGPMASAVMLALILALPIFFIWFYPRRLRILELKFEKRKK
jgi:uncharacterized delta-60 repeat protein